MAGYKHSILRQNEDQEHPVDVYERQHTEAWNKWKNTSDDSLLTGLYDPIFAFLNGMNKVTIDYEMALAMTRVNKEDPILLMFRAEIVQLMAPKYSKFSQYFQGLSGADRVGIARSLSAKAMQLGLKERAERGCPVAQTFVGDMFISPISPFGVRPNVQEACEEAFKWYKKAVDQDDAHAEYTMATFLIKLGYSSEYAKKYLHLAASQGHAGAQWDIRGLIYSGAVSNEAESALVWANRAADQGYYPALEFLE